MNLKLKEKAGKTADFVKQNPYEVAYATYIVGCFVTGMVISRKIKNHFEYVQRLETSREDLRMAVAAGHKFKYDPVANELWDITIRTDKAA